MFNFVYLQLTHKWEHSSTLTQILAFHSFMFVDVLDQAMRCQITFIAVFTFAELFVGKPVVFTYFLSCVASNVAKF